MWNVKLAPIHNGYLGIYVDAIAREEIPNRLGMNQYVDGGVVDSKPYIASGACPFTTLYWSFIYQHQDWLAINPRLGMQVKIWHNKDVHEQAKIHKRANWLYQTQGQSKSKEKA